MPEILDYRTQEPKTKSRHTPWGLAALVFGVVLLVWITLPFLGVPPERVDVFHNLELAGPVMGVEGICFAACGLGQGGRRRDYARLAILVNFIAALAAGILWVKL